jgi:aldose 1-epimerase
MDASTSTGEQDGVATATLAAGELEATFATGAGMVCCSLRDRGAELLGQRRGLATYAASGSTMGIPFLHPWANRLAGLSYEQGGRTVTLREGAPGLRLEEHGLPMHGLLGGSRDWRVELLEGQDEQARLVAELRFERPELLESFPFAHRLTFTAVLAPGALRIAVAVRATGDAAVPVSFGFHPYLQLGGERAALELTLPARTHLALDARRTPSAHRWASAPSTTTTPSARTPSPSRRGMRSARSPCASSMAIPSRRSSRRPASPSSASSR